MILLFIGFFWGGAGCNTTSVEEQSRQPVQREADGLRHEATGLDEATGLGEVTARDEVPDGNVTTDLGETGPREMTERNEVTDPRATGRPETTDLNETGLLQLSDEQLRSFELTYTGLNKRNINEHLRLSGKVVASPENLVSVSFPLGGYVSSINLLPGTHFKKGQVLAVLEDNQYIQLQEDYLTTKTRLKMAELNFYRQKDLNENKAASDKVLESAEMEYRTLLVTEKALEEKLKLIGINPQTLTVQQITRSVRIYAPFSGVVSAVGVNKGKYVAPGDVLFELVNPTYLLLHLKVFEKALGEISVGQVLSAYSNEQPGNRLNARIVTIGSQVHDNGTVDVHARIEGSAAGVIPGRYMNAEVVTLEIEAYTLPEQAVVDFEGKHYVFEAVDDHTFRWISVRVGKRSGGYVEIPDPATMQNRKLVDSGAYTLLMALKNEGE